MESKVSVIEPRFILWVRNPLKLHKLSGLLEKTLNTVYTSPLAISVCTVATGDACKCDYSSILRLIAVYIIETGTGYRISSNSISYISIRAVC